jgi:hypothetical protein
MYKIAPAFASDITLTFTEFHTEADADLVKIYDATTNQLLVTLSGEYTAGNMPDPIYCDNGALFLTFQSDGAFNAPGFTGEWEIGNTAVNDQNDTFNQLRVYPNPAQNILNVSFSAEENQSFSIRLITVTGNVVYEQNTTDFSGHYVNTIDLSDMANGVYFLSLSSEKGSVNKKVVVK